MSMNFDDLAAAYGGVLSTAQILESGHTERDIANAVAVGVLTRVRRGWYALNDADPTVAAAVTAGGVASCLFALDWHGIWVPGENIGMHCRLTRHGLTIHGQMCSRYGRPTPAVGAIDDVPTALAHSPHCLNAEGFIVVCDSIANQKVMTLDEIADHFADAPLSLRSLLSKCDARAQSGVETIVRTRLRSKGYKVEVQYRVAPGIHADLRVGDRLGIEVDGKKHHTGEDNYEYDRWRDRQYLKHGMIPAHVTYKQAIYQWPQTFADIRAICSAGLHRDRKAEAARRLGIRGESADVLLAG